jgi:hypothetical protein
MSLVNELIKGLLPEEEKKQTTAVYAGGFKPPTSGHFEVVQQALKENPEIDEFIIFIGNKERNGISQDESLLIWEIYNNYLPFKVKIEPTSIPPIKAVYDFAKNHPTREVLWIMGAREGNEEDFKDITSRTKSITKYPNLELRTIITKGGVSGTAARNAAKISLEKFKPFVPSELSDEEVEEVYDIVSNKVQEILTENASYSENINLKREIAKLTKHMIDKGMNIQPLPKLVFKNGDSENAKQFLGKTAYYDPNSQSIVLYTEGRHPKDIVRSFSHEMVHHTQFLEDRLGDVSTTNTMEDDNINKLEQEANLKGTMTFRNWTDSLNEGIDDQLKQYIDGDIDMVDVDLLKNLLKFKSKNPEDLDPRTGGNKYGYRGMTFDKDFIKTLNVKNKSNGTTEYEVPSNTKITSKNDRGFLSFSTDEEVAKGFGHYSGYVDHKKSPDKVGGYVKVSLDNSNFILHPDYVSKLSQDLEYSKESEKETLYIGNSFAPKSIFVVDKDLYKLKEDKKKDPFGLNAYARELAMGLEENKVMDYKIYVDMDGVVADFDQRFKDLSGMLPREFEAKYGKDAFWDFIDEGKNKLKFWVGIPPMSDAKQLIDYVSKYNYEMLTAPSTKKQSLMGKGLWMINQTKNGLFPFKPKINYKSAKNKKDFAAPNHILIDDREDTINNWNASGGIGILHTSAANTISQLKKLSL